MTQANSERVGRLKVKPDPDDRRALLLRAIGLATTVEDGMDLNCLEDEIVLKLTEHLGRHGTLQQVVASIEYMAGPSDPSAGGVCCIMPDGRTFWPGVKLCRTIEAESRKAE